MNMMEAQRQGIALYEAMIKTLDEIPDMDVRSDVAFNLMKYMATERAKASSKDNKDWQELSNLFEAECKRVSDELLSLPGQFREWMKQDEERAKRSSGAGGNVGVIEIIAIQGMPTSLADSLIVTCDCEDCRRYRRGESPLDESEAKTEPPPPEAKPS
jgi:hypothetical protein